VPDSALLLLPAWSTNAAGPLSTSLATDMGARQKQWAKRARLALIVPLGGVCTRCKCDDLDRLTIHHLQGCTWSEERRNLDPSTVVSRYRREALDGLLGVLCVSCNPAVGSPVRIRKTQVWIKTGAG